jgi:hypothetical protein
MDEFATLLHARWLMLELMRATGHYVVRRIESKQGREAYIHAMRTCIKHVEDMFHKDDYDMALVKQVLLEFKPAGEITLYPKRFFSLSRKDSVRYHQMAVSQAIEIVSYIESRFVTGANDPGPRLHKYNGEILHEDKSIFG